MWAYAPHGENAMSRMTGFEVMVCVTSVNTKEVAGNFDLIPLEFSDVEEKEIQNNLFTYCTTIARFLKT